MNKPPTGSKLDAGEHRACWQGCRRNLDGPDDGDDDRVDLNSEQRQILERLAGRYVWWQPEYQTLAQPRRLLAQVMNMGDWRDVEQMRSVIDDDALEDVLATAQPGEFNRRSWNFWHLLLKQPHGSNLPPLPQRKLG